MVLELPGLPELPELPALIFLFSPFLHICRDLHTFVVMQEILRFMRLGSQKNVNPGLRAKKTEFAALSEGIVKKVFGQWF